VLVASSEWFPLRIWGPLAVGGPEAEVAVVTSGGGLLDDHLHITIHTAVGAKVRLRQIGATRLLAGREASSALLEAHLEPDSSLIALSEPYIPCGSTVFEQRTTIVMDETASAIVGEVVTAGREGLGERFEYRRLAFRLQVFMSSRLVLQDQLSLEPARGHLPALLGNNSHLATLAVLGRAAAETLPRAIHDLLQASPVKGGASQPVPGVVVVRILGRSAFELQQLLSSIVDLASAQAGCGS
jgi:urease accessory protein